MTELMETGVRAVDLYAPLAHGGRLAIAGEPGAGQAVLAFEIVRNLCARQGARARWLVAAEDLEQFRRSLREAGLEPTAEPAEGTTRAEVRRHGELIASIVLGDDAAAESRVRLSRELLRSGQLPAVDARESATRLPLDGHAELAQRARAAIVEGSTSGGAVLAFLRQWFAVAEPWTGQPGEYTPLAETLAGVRQLLSPA